MAPTAGDAFDGAAQRCRWQAVPDLQALQRRACDLVLDAAARAIRARGRFLLVLAGGNTPRGVYERLAAADATWSAWHIHFGDERCLARDDPARNSRMAGSAWLDRVAIPAAQQHPIPAELGATVAAMHHAQTLATVGPFDLVLLGLGDDGHTASLFPGHAWGETAGSPSTLAVLDAPLPYCERVSLSAARLGAAGQVLFLVAGTEKRDALRRWRTGERLPASAVRPDAGVDILADHDALGSDGRVAPAP